MDPYEKQCRAIGEAREILGSVCTAAGVPGLSDVFDMQYVNSLGGCIVQIRRQPAPCEGTEMTDRYCEMYGLGGAPVAEGRMMLRQEAEKLCRLHLRTKAIAGPPGADDPTWSHHIHPVALSVLRHFGLTDHEICKVEGSYQMRKPSMLRTIVRDGHGNSLTIEKAANNSGRITVLLRLATMHGAEITIDTMNNDPRITIKGAEIPDTARLALIGQTIDRLLGHPCFDGSDIAMTEITDADEGGLNVRMSRRNVPLAPAPDGADISWMDLDV